MIICIKETYEKKQRESFVQINNPDVINKLKTDKIVHRSAYYELVIRLCIVAQNQESIWAEKDYHTILSNMGQYFSYLRVALYSICPSTQFMKENILVEIDPLSQQKDHIFIDEDDDDTSSDTKDPKSLDPFDDFELTVFIDKATDDAIDYCKSNNEINVKKLHKNVSINLLIKEIKSNYNFTDIAILSYIFDKNYNILKTDKSICADPEINRLMSGNNFLSNTGDLRILITKINDYKVPVPELGATISEYYHDIILAQNAAVAYSYMNILCHVIPKPEFEYDRTKYLYGFLSSFKKKLEYLLNQNSI